MGCDGVKDFMEREADCFGFNDEFFDFVAKELSAVCGAVVKCATFPPVRQASGAAVLAESMNQTAPPETARSVGRASILKVVTSPAGVTLPMIP